LNEKPQPESTYDISLRLIENHLGHVRIEDNDSIWDGEAAKFKPRSTTSVFVDGIQNVLNQGGARDFSTSFEMAVRPDRVAADSRIFPLRLFCRPYDNGNGRFRDEDT
jgi:hypothetical protein